MSTASRKRRPLVRWLFLISLPVTVFIIFEVVTGYFYPPIGAPSGVDGSARGDTAYPAHAITVNGHEKVPRYGHGSPQFV